MENVLLTIAAIAILLTAGIIYLRFSLRALKKSLPGETDHQSLQIEVAALRERVESRDSELASLREERDAARSTLDEARSELSRLNADHAQLKTRLEQEGKAASEKLKALESSEKRLGEQFENLANRIFEEKHEKFAETSKSGVESLLKPMREQLEGFRKKVEDVYDKESKDRTSLFNQIVHLQELNERMSSEALNLTRALKGESKTRGNWGEVQLERILEASGLEKGREYEVQVHAYNDAGKRFAPDVIVHLPEKKDVVIDSKVSLVAYDRYHSAESDAERQQAMKEHVASIRGHLNNLESKSYAELIGLNSLDLVIMFVPIDAALLLALEHEPDLIDAAFSQNVWLVSPMNLIGTLRIIHNIWRYEYQNRNAVEIATQAGRLHDQFVSFNDALQDIGKFIGKTQAAYETAHKRLIDGRGNLVVRTQQLQKLGAKAKKSIPEALLQQADKSIERSRVEHINDTAD